MKKILFVCLGNICHSPMAEFVMKDLAGCVGGMPRTSESRSTKPAEKMTAQDMEKSCCSTCPHI